MSTLNCPMSTVAMLSRHDLYELCVQSPRHAVPLLRVVHGGEPRVLGEDFAGTAALSHLWVEWVEGGRAIAVDLDPETLRVRPDDPRVLKLVGDVRTATRPAEHDADVIFVGNFSIGELHTRDELLEYLQHARSRLRPGGVFVCDTYGGETAFLVGSVERDHWTEDGRRVRYTWEQREADPLTGMVVNALHFRVDRGGEVEQTMHDAFIYRWRLWSVPELRDAMREAGFASTEVHDHVPDAVDDDGNVYATPIRSGDEVDASFIVLVVGRT